MSLKVLVIPEDPLYNGAILKPIAERVLEGAGWSQAIVNVLTTPRVRGIADAKRAIREDLPRRYRHVPLWLFLPDADRAGDLSGLERDLQAQAITLLCCAAQPEVEAWLFAGHRDRLGLPWRAIREHRNLKEEVFEPFLAEHGDLRLPDEGRGMLVRETLRNYRGLLEVCPELKELEERLRQHPRLASP
jgi:hypothetical protein